MKIKNIVLSAFATFILVAGFSITTTTNAQNPQAQTGKCGFTVTSISPNTPVSFPLTIKGLIDNSNSQKLGCTWNMFEGQAGTAQLYYNYKDSGWKLLGISVPIQVADWTQLNTSFSTTLNFNNGGIGLPDGTPIKITFTEENASGLPPVDTYDLPVKLRSTSQNPQASPESNVSVRGNRNRPSLARFIQWLFTPRDVLRGPPPEDIGSS